MKNVPQEVIDSLSPAELEEFQKLAGLPKETFGWLRVEDALTANRGIRYLIMNEPMKYTLLQYDGVTEEDLLALLSYDAAGLDAYHECLWQGREAEGLWSQRFDSVMAALGNPNLSCKNAKRLLDELMAEAHEPISSEEFLEVVTYQLEDKWELRNFTSEVLGALINLLEQEGMTEHLPATSDFSAPHSRKNPADSKTNVWRDHDYFRE